MRTTELTKILNGKLVGDDVTFQGVSIDTRTLEKDNLYIAIKGDRFDGHAFCHQAEVNGAGAIIVSTQQSVSIPQIIVKNTRAALMQIAQHHRDCFQIPVIGITGSCGKTTVRALVESILKQVGNVLASQKSYNNDIGVPLTLLQLSSSDEFAVIEMGANHAGEISQLTNIVKPTVAILTCAAEAHLAGFGSLKGISRAKGEIFQGLPADGVAIINADDQFCDYWQGLVNDKKVMTFGMGNHATVFADNVTFNQDACPCFTLHSPVGQIDIQLPLMGLHNVRNALAAAAASLAINVSLAQIKQGLESVVPVSGRLVAQKGVKGATIIDDSYNANPTSVAAAIDLLVNRAGQSVLVLGDMLEMGDEAENIHATLGKLARQKGLHQLYCYGPLTQNTAQAFGDNGQHFMDKKKLISTLKDDLTDQMTVLIKGSNSMGMKEVVEALLD